jgi:hypothetical protein
MTTTILENVVALLARLDITATVEYPGYLAVPAGDGLTWNLGTANPTWGGELIDVDGGQLHATDFGVPSTSTNAELIANKISKLVR